MTRNVSPEDGRLLDIIAELSPARAAAVRTIAEMEWAAQRGRIPADDSPSARLSGWITVFRTAQSRDAASATPDNVVPLRPGDGGET